MKKTRGRRASDGKEQKDEIPFLHPMSDLAQLLQESAQQMALVEIDAPSGDPSLSVVSHAQLVCQLIALEGEVAARALVDKNSAQLLYLFALRTTAHLWQVAERAPENLKETAETKMVFPCCFPVHKGSRALVLKKMESLGVGNRAVRMLRGRKHFNTQIPLNRFVISLLAEMDEMRYEAMKARDSWKSLGYQVPFFQRESLWTKAVLALPDFKRTTVDQWLPVVWERVLEVTQGKPELDSRLRMSGAHRAKHSIHTGQQHRVTEKTKEANIRDGIKKRILQFLQKSAP